MTEKQETILQEVRGIVIETRTELKTTSRQVDKNTIKIDGIEDIQHSFITRDECQAHRDRAGQQKNQQENRKQTVLGRRQADRLALRGFIALIVFSTISTIVAIISLIKDFIH